MKRHSQSGFSLIELLIVVAIILIIAAIAVPNLLRARISANEASAVSSIHAINTANITYAAANPDLGFAATLLALGPGVGDYIDSNLASGTKSGYKFTYVAPGAVPHNSYTIQADPLVRSITGARSFFSDESNITRYNQTAPASNTDNSLQ